MSSLVVRAMKRAVYVDSCEGHFGLASTAYTHFTSPIRRYPDLMVHRMLKVALFGRTGETSGLESALARIADHASTAERTAEEAARESQELKLFELLEQRIGDEVDGMISGVMAQGFFVRLADTCEGFVSLRDTGEYFVLDAACCSVPIRAWSIAWARRCACAFRRCTPMLAAPTSTLCAASAPGSSPESNALFLARLFSSRRRGILKVRNTVGKGPSCFLRNRFLICARRAFCIAGARLLQAGARYTIAACATMASRPSSTRSWLPKRAQPKAIALWSSSTRAPISLKITPVRVRRRFSTTACASMPWRSRSITQLVPIAMRAFAAIVLQYLPTASPRSWSAPNASSVTTRPMEASMCCAISPWNTANGPWGCAWRPTMRRTS